MKVAVLGCGPAGLVAAWAAIGLGHEVMVISDKWEPSTLYGCQYLHMPIPGFQDVPKVKVDYQLLGTTEMYRSKVYGENWEGKVSPEDMRGTRPAWDIRETYGRLWNKIVGSEQIQKVLWTVKEGNLRAVYNNDIDRIVSSIPARNLCHNLEHGFDRQLIYAQGATEWNATPENTVICDGTDQWPWYRISNVFGYQTVEWPAGRGLPRPKDSVRVYKPLSTNCVCHGDVIRVGRYGAWDKSVLVHQVYDKVVKELS